MSGTNFENAPLAFGKVLRSHRLARGFSQEQLGLEAGVQRNFISLIELGHNQPTISTILKLASALSVSASLLIQETEMEIRMDGDERNQEQR